MSTMPNEAWNTEADIAKMKRIMANPKLLDQFCHLVEHPWCDGCRNAEGTTFIEGDAVGDGIFLCEDCLANRIKGGGGHGKEQEQPVSQPLTHEKH